MNHTALNREKVLTVARIAKFLVDTRFEESDHLIAQQMVGEGIRKAHDAAKSFRGRGKYLGHAHWSRGALKLLSDNGGIERGITDLLSHEHVVPVSVLVNDILFANSRDTGLEEYARLAEAKLGSLMPVGWHQTGVWARYIQVELMEEILSV